LPDNLHVFVREDGAAVSRFSSCLYWLGVLQWRLGGSRESASPASQSWGKGEEYCSVPGGESARYAPEGYASDGLRFNWNPTPAERKIFAAPRRRLLFLVAAYRAKRAFRRMAQH